MILGREQRSWERAHVQDLEVSLLSGGGHQFAAIISCGNVWRGLVSINGGLHITPSSKMRFKTPQGPSKIVFEPKTVSKTPQCLLSQLASLSAFRSLSGSTLSDFCSNSTGPAIVRAGDASIFGVGPSLLTCGILFSTPSDQT